MENIKKGLSNRIHAFTLEYGLRNFCKEQNLNASWLSAIVTGNRHCNLEKLIELKLLVDSYKKEVLR